MSSREQILARVRAATKDSPRTPEPPRDIRRSLGAEADLVELLVDRLVDYRASVDVISAADLPRTIGNIFAREQVRSVAVPADIDPTWLVTVTCRVHQDAPPLSKTDLDGTDAVLTASALAVADTGTIVLDGGGGQGRRVLSLLLDLHLCIVRADTIVGTVPEAVARLNPRYPLTWISGPSATSDIELSRVEGVHGPRRLHVLIVR